MNQLEYLFQTGENPGARPFILVLTDSPSAQSGVGVMIFEIFAI
jgi:hypothetical protein